MIDNRLVPIVAQGAERCIANRKLRRIALWSAAVGALGCALAATIAAPPRPWLVWNVSASAPVGLYRVGGLENLGQEDMVIAWPPAGWRRFAARRHYIPANVPLVKRVSALPGDRVCAIGPAIVVNGLEVAKRRAVDGLGRPMPAWSGCVTLVGGQYLLLMDSADSFDGRYFGPSAKADIVGKGTLLWRR